MSKAYAGDMKDSYVYVPSLSLRFFLKHMLLINCPLSFGRSIFTLRH